MTKLEQKLAELGYRKEQLPNEITIYVKRYNYYFSFVIAINKEKVENFIYPEHIIYQIHKKDSDNLQQAFDVMQRDLEELKKCQD